MPEVIAAPPRLRSVPVSKPAPTRTMAPPGRSNSMGSFGDQLPLTRGLGPGGSTTGVSSTNVGAERSWSFRRQTKKVDTANACLPQNDSTLSPLRRCCPTKSRHRSAVNNCLLIARQRARRLPSVEHVDYGTVTTVTPAVDDASPRPAGLGAGRRLLRPSRVDHAPRGIRR